MNKVQPQTPLPLVVEMMEQDGYVLLEEALDEAQLGALNAAYDVLVQQRQYHPDSDVVSRNGWFEIRRLLEKGPEFEKLMEHPPVFSIAREVLGYDIELASGGELDLRAAHSGAHISWHSDFQWMTNVPLPRQNFWIRAVYLLSDVTAEMGPFTLLPGTHLNTQPCPDDWVDDQGHPLEREGMVQVVGKAGSCLLCNTEIWHTATPNTTDHERRLIMILYKHSWMKPWQDGYEISEAFAQSQQNSLRRQLCGLTTWHQGKERFAATNYDEN